MKRLVVLAACLVLVACGSRRPPLLAPERTESFCAEKEPRGTAIASILSSTSDRFEQSQPFPGDDTLRMDVKTNGGIIGHWKSQLVYLPAIAKALGMPNNYVDVQDVYINNQLSGTESRLIYLNVTTPAGPKSIVLRAYDTQNVCVEGTRLS